MSLEDLDSWSDESDYEAGKNLSDGENDDDDEELVYLQDILMRFEHIYCNNAIMDLQYSEDWSSFSFDGLDSELRHLQDNINSAWGEMFSTNSSAPSPVTSPWDGSSPGIDYSTLFSSIWDYQLDIAATTSSSSSVDLDDVD